MRAKVSEIRRLIWLVATAVSIAVVVLTYFVAARVVSPIGTLTNAAKAISAGDYGQRVQLRSQDELGALAQSFNQMSVKLSGREAELRDSTQRLATVLEGMADGVIAVDDDFRVLLANSACHEMLDTTDKDVDGRPLLEVTRSRALYDAVAQALSRPGALTTDLVVGESPPRHFLLRTSQLPGDPCPGVVVVLHDVTEVRRLESIRKEFVANVSHELKTPLASIKAYAETLRMGAVNDPDHNISFVTRIEEDANRLHDLIADMLQIARIESHQQAFRIGPVELDAQVEKCVRDMSARAAAKDISLLIEPASETVKVSADAEGVQTILANLVDNAIKYTPPEGTVSIRWGREGDAVVLEVEDTGMGIEAENLDRIFERFFRVDRARNRDSGGTGLGLSIVKHLVQAFGGGVSVTSKLGLGSCFRVRLALEKMEKVGD